MFNIELLNDVGFQGDNTTSILDSALSSGIYIDYSCLDGRCKSCICKVNTGKYKFINDQTILSKEEMDEKYILTCNTIPLSDLYLDIEDLSEYNLCKPKILPAKINDIIMLNDYTMKLILRIPPNSNINFNAGQYINIIKDKFKRSYSLSNNFKKDSNIELFIKYYDNGLMSNYLFKNAKKNDLLRIEGPLGTFFYKNSNSRNIIFLATGTGIAPVKAILDMLNKSKEINLNSKKIWLFWGQKYRKDFYWVPKYENLSINFFPVVSRENKEKKYIQDELMNSNINFSKSQIYACGSNEMIKSVTSILSEINFDFKQFYSDAFLNSY